MKKQRGILELQNWSPRARRDLLGKGGTALVARRARDEVGLLFRL